MAFAPFVPLRVLSSYTMLEGTIEPKALATLAVERGFPAIAMTDRNGLYGAPEFAYAAKAAGIQPIIGALIGVARPEAEQGTRRAGFGISQPVIDWLPLYAKDETGYENLCRLVSCAHMDRPLDLPAHVTLDLLAERSDGLIALTGAGDGAVARMLAEGQQLAAEAYLARLEAMFAERLYVELARRDDAVEVAAEAALIDLAYSRDLPLVATNPASHGDPSDFAAHDAMLCIGSSSYLAADDRPRGQREHWVKSAPMMAEIFADLPEALANTLVVAQRCAVAPPKRKEILPSLAGDKEGEALQLAADARTGLAKRLEKLPDLTEAEKQVYFDRLEFEIGVINQMGFGGYFLIVADFIKWAKEQNIPVGPGRGSGAGSLVAWSLTITDLDPIPLGLLFERFLNPERVSMPDFDIDFCETRRGEVIRYVQRKYGRDHVAQIITFGKMKARAAIRDTGRIMQMGYGRVNDLCKLIPALPTDPWDLKRTLNGIADFRRAYDNDDDVKALIDLALRIENKPRNSSTHAAGVVIGDRPLDLLVPLYRDPRSDMPVTQFDMKQVESAGLVKFDFLGLKTLSVLHKAVELLKKREIEVDLDALGWDDPAVYRLLQSGDTVGVFQLESEGMRRTLAAVKPTNFADIVALVSLYRPGPMDNIPLFGRRKNGLEPVEYPHPKLEAILAETNGIFVYQEQVMEAARILAGYTLGGADLLRRAMGKKIKDEMDSQRAIFVSGCAEHSGIPAAKANELFDLIAKFADYGFNKSHAAAYAVLSYQTAWMKTHYPHEFYAASMCFDMHQSEKLAVFVDDMRRAGVALAPPCVNRSEADFSVERTDEGYAVRYALGGLRNVGEKAMELLVAQREGAGWFTSLENLFERLPPQAMNSRQLIALAGAGAFDSLEANRAAVVASAELLQAHAESASRTRESGQAALFAGDDSATPALRLSSAQPWSRAELMAAEKEAFGFYFAEHPVSAYRAIANANGARSHASLISNDMAGGSRAAGVMAAMVEGVQRRKTRKGKDFIIADFSDASGQFSASCFEESLVEPFMQWAKESRCLLLNVELDRPSPDEPPRITLRSARPIDEVNSAAKMLLSLDVQSEPAIHALAQMLPRGPSGRGEVRARLMLGDGRAAAIILGQNFALDAELVDGLANIDGLANVALSVQRDRPDRHQFRVVN